MKKIISTAVVLILVLAMTLVGCGSQTSGKVPALKAGEALELTEWSLNATAWSSPNGATVNLSAVPNGYAEGQSAVFCVRLEGEEIASVPCEWDGSVYTASADLNAADGYCYYVQLTAADGVQSEIAVNTPTAVQDQSLINMASALTSYCEASVSASHMDGDALIVDDGTVKIQMPWLTLDEGSVSTKSAVLVLVYNGENVAQQELVVPEAGEDGICQIDLSDMRFQVPAGLEDDHQLTMRLDVVLTNEHVLTAPGGVWFYADGGLVLAAG